METAVLRWTSEKRHLCRHAVKTLHLLFLSYFMCGSYSLYAALKDCYDGTDEVVSGARTPLSANNAAIQCVTFCRLENYSHAVVLINVLKSQFS